MSIQSIGNGRLILATATLVLAPFPSNPFLVADSYSFSVDNLSLAHLHSCGLIPTDVNHWVFIRKGKFGHLIPIQILTKFSWLATLIAIVLVPKDMPFDFSRFVKSWIFAPIRLVAISRAMTDDKVTHGRCCFIATSPSPTTFRSVVGRFRRPLATDCANLARLSNTVVQTLDSRIYAAAGDDRSQSLDVGFLEIHPVEKFGFVRCSVSIFHLMILLYFYLSAN